MSPFSSSRGTARYPIDSGELQLRQDGQLLTAYINGVESSCLNTSDPTDLDFEYMQHMTCVLHALGSQAFPHERMRALHLGGAGCALPRAWAALFARSRHTAVEIDAQLAQLARELFDLPKAPALKIRVGDGREVVEQSRPASWNVIVRDAFIDGVPPQSLRSVAFARYVARTLTEDGVYVLNCAHGGGCDARQDAAALRQTFGMCLAITDPKVGRGGRRGNVVLVAWNPLNEARVSSTVQAEDPITPLQSTSDSPATFLESPTAKSPVEVTEIIDIPELDRLLRRLPLPARTLVGKEFNRWCAGAKPLSDPPKEAPSSKK